MNELSLVQWLIAVGAVAGALTTVGVFTRKAWRSTSEFFRNAHAAARIINAELQANGGGSLVDKVNRIPGIESRLDAHIEETQTHFQAIELKCDELAKGLHAVSARIKGSG